MVLDVIGQSRLFPEDLPMMGASAVKESLTNRMSTVEKYIAEKTHANNLKMTELDLIMRKLKLKETELAELGDTRNGVLLKMCIDCLVAGILIMSISLFYGACVFSFGRINDATFSCQPSKESSSWWIPKQVTLINSGMNNLRCYLRVSGKLISGLLLIVVIIYLLTQRSKASKKTMPITLGLLLGVGCGVTGKFFIDTLGGSGYHWLVLWETLWAIYFVANIFTSVLFVILYGPIDVFQRIRSKPVIPYWIRRLLFFGSVLLFLPLSGGLIPFAGFVEWKDHFSQVLVSFRN